MNVEGDEATGARREEADVDLERVCPLDGVIVDDVGPPTVDGEVEEPNVTDRARVKPGDS